MGGELFDPELFERHFPFEREPIVGESRLMGIETKQPPRGVLPPEVEQAARLIHRAVWNAPYRPGDGPMHHAGGSYWGNDLRRRADEWERMAAAARVCAEFLP